MNIKTKVLVRFNYFTVIVFYCFNIIAPILIELNVFFHEFLNYPFVEPAFYIIRFGLFQSQIYLEVLQIKE